MSTQEQQFAQLYRVARSAARSVAASAPGVVDVEDLTQDGLLWLLEHPQRVEHATLPDGSLYFTRIVGEVARHLSGLIRNELALAGRLDPSDRYAYSVKVIDLVLPYVMDPVGSMAPPVQVETGMPRSQSDPAESGNWHAMVMDLKTAVEKVCSLEDKRVLFTRAVGGWTWQHFGEVLPMSGETYRLRYWDAIKRIAIYLNDGVVLEDGPDDEAVEEALNPTPVAQRSGTDPDEDTWKVAGRDRYVEPEC